MINNVKKNAKERWTWDAHPVTTHKAASPRRLSECQQMQAISAVLSEIMNKSVRENQTAVFKPHALPVWFFMEISLPLSHKLTDYMENGGFRGLLGIEKMVLCSKLCCNIAKLKKHMGK